MKKLKFVFWLVFVGFFALLVYQNLGFFSAKNILQINLGIYQRSTPELTNGVIIAAFVGIGVFVMLIFYFSSRYAVYKSRKTIKELQSNLEERTSAIASLKEELESLKQGMLLERASSEESQEPESLDDPEEAQVAQSSQA
jgi:NADH:ubiquinone oxidoreductase subunit 5 (subunit L)/multisubunit Na+/H+ antiporter MnhA subunit